MTLPPEGWGGRVVAVAVAGLTAIIALTSSDVRLGRVRFAVGAALAAIIAAALARAVSSDALLGIAFVVDSLLLAVAAITILRRVVPSAQVDFRTILGAISVFTLLGLLSGSCSSRLDAWWQAMCSPASLTRRLGLSVLQLHDADDDRLRQSGAGRGHRPDPVRV